MSNILLYSRGCPKCNVLKKKLDSKNIPYTETDNMDMLIDKGFKSMPVLYVNGEYLKFEEAVKWLNSVEV